MAKEKLKIKYKKNSNNNLDINLEIFDDSIIWKEGKLRLVLETIVHDSRPVNESKVLKKEVFKVLDWWNKFSFNLKDYRHYSYDWNMISIHLTIEVVIDDAIFFDTKVRQKILDDIWFKPKLNNWSPELILDPKDNFNFMENIKAIPNDAKIYVFWLSIIWWIVILINMALWIHDQMVPDGQTFFYSHYDSDWDSNSPFFDALASSGALWAWIWALMKSQLRRYMKFFFKKWVKFWVKWKQYKLSEIVWWRSLVDLKDIKLRVVSGNLENGQYIRGSGSNRRTVSFSEPIRALVLHEEYVDFIPKRADISEYLKWSFSFDEMYKALYPEQMISSTHWLSVRWEVQLIHNKFIDQELVWDNKDFKFEDFLEW